MPWPLSQDYNEAIQSPAANFADPDLRRGKAVVNALGLPMPCTGNFADVYQVRCPDGSRWAVKCFTREVAGLRERYQEISQHLRRAKLPFMVSFNYLEQGIRVAGRWYPVLKMQWVEGLTLNQFLEQYLDKPAMLEALRQVWGRLAKYLRAAEVGHCDLQHGNVLLVPGTNANSLALKLVDYDGMWVPALAGKQPGELGHPSYQHPQRARDGTYSLEVDRFPLLLVYCAIRALAVGGRPLWKKYDCGDNLLFRESDLRTPRESPLLHELIKLDNPELREWVNHLSRAVYKPLDQVPLLEELVAIPSVSPTPPRAAASARQPVSSAKSGPASTGRTNPDSEPITSIPRKAHKKQGKYAFLFAACAGAVLLGGLGCVLIATSFLRSGAPADTGSQQANLTGPKGPHREPSPNKAPDAKPPSTTPQPAPDPTPEPVKPSDPPRPAQAGSGKTPAELRDAAVAWFKENNNQGAATPSKDLKALLEENVDENTGFLVWLRPGVVKAGKATVLCGWDGDFFVFEVSPEQAMDFPPKDIWVQHVPYSDQLRKPRQFTLSALKIDSAANPDPAKKITGSVACKRLAAGGGQFALRLTQVGPKGDVFTRFSPVTEIVGKDGASLQFDFADLALPSDKGVGTSVAFVEVVSFPGAKREGTPTVLSNPVAKLGTLIAGKQEKPPGPAVAGKEEKRPVPVPAAQAAAEKLIKDLFKDEYAKREPAALRELSTRLFEQGRETKDDNAARFVSFREASELAAKAGDYEAAFRVIDQMAKEYAVDALELKTAALTAASQTASIPAAGKALAESALALIEGAVAEDSYEAATRLLPVAEAAAKKAQSVSLVAQVAARGQEVRDLHQSYEAAKAALATLKEKPDDPEANLVAGKFLCFGKRQWERGLPLLLRGSDPQLKTLAEKEQAKPTTPAEQEELADAWWDRAQAEQGKEKVAYLRRASHWYQQALPGLKGLHQTRVEKRIESMGEQVPELRLPVELHCLTGHKGAIRVVAFSPDGHRILSGSLDTVIRLWDVETGKEERAFEAKTGPVVGAGFSADGSKVLSAAGPDPGQEKKQNWAVRRWDIASGAGEGMDMSEESSATQSVIFALFPDGQRAVHVREGNAAGMQVGCWLKVLNLEDAKKTTQVFVQTKAVPVVMVVAADGQKALSGGGEGREGALWLWDLKAGKASPFASPGTGVRSLALSADGRRALSGGADGLIRLWDMSGAKELRRLSGHTGPVTAVAFSPDGHRVLSGGQDKTVRLWDAETAKELRRLQGHTDQVLSVAFSADGRRAVSGSADKTVRVWRLPK
jgi:hypothetical protein